MIQVFRFMVMNSFFKGGPERPLRFPSVNLSENGTEGSELEERCFMIATGNHGISLGSNEGDVNTDNTGRKGIMYMKKMRKWEKSLTET
ncbi:hypothetical protein SAY86_007836 [Trapa natans]|uniref:Uncharacterized protein n=1 Tax=Trapa natans TaxID=22666 RepID=A0AAN7LBL2_TRANT|nr:hypothetical protein SAY86_007836 [Trapa natans]